MRLIVFVSIMAAGTIPMLISIYVAFALISTDIKEKRYEDVKTNASIITNMISKYGYSYSQEGSASSIEIDALANHYSGRILVIDKNLNIVKDSYNKENGKVCISADVIKCFKEGQEIKIENNLKRYTELLLPMKDEKGSVTGVLVMGYSQKDIYDIMVGSHRSSLVLLVALGILLGIPAFVVSGKLSKGIKNIKKNVDEISDGYADQEIRVDDYAEISSLSDSLNSMIQKQQRLENTRQEFVSNVSHELKTPITSMKVLADSLIAQEDVPNELYKEFMTDIAAEIERENKIINDLLSLVKMDKSASELNVENININDLMEILLKRLRPLASERNIEIIFESFRAVDAEVDETKISLAFSNLIENAIKYNFEDGWVRVSLNADHKYFYVKVADSGVGIPQDCLDNIFERFYRVDKARSRETGGTGLGLSITRNVILMHKGAIKVHSEEGEGTTFTVRIPLSYVV